MSTKNVRIIVAALALALGPAVQAQATEPTTDLNKGQNLVATKIARNFTGIAGGDENSLALVRALRTGTEVRLVTTVPPPAGSPAGTQPTTTTTSFTPPTKPMGWGNVKHALALAQSQLQQAGITNPTAEQLQTALMGGDLVRTNADGTTSTTTVKGVLTMRADGMGWGNIAKASGTTLGAATSKVDMSAKGVKSTTTTTGVTTAAAGTGTTAKSKGVTTAAGGSSATTPKGITTATGATSTSGSRGLTTASGASANASPQGNAYGRGIVTGAGGGATNVAATGAGKGHGGGVGLVTGGGGSAAGVTTAGNNAGGNGNGKGQGGEHGKGKGG